MKGSNRKLIALAFLVLTAITLIVTVSYAWITLSGKPALTGVEINIGGTNTIQIAPNMVAVVDGKTVSYPGAFQSEFRFSDYSSYSYLNTLTGLTPVSTADGIHWFMPSGENEMEVKGDYSLDDYLMDNTLSHANISKDSTLDVLEGKKGSYVYLDFWVVSPMSNCNLRVSIGSKNEGSFVIGLPQVVKDASTLTGYKLVTGSEEAANCARVGFLVNTEEITDETVLSKYQSSGAYVSKYQTLKGVYQEKGEVISDPSKYQFTIYEPNGDSHNNNGVSYVQTENGLTYMMCQNGDYAITRPIGYKNGKPVLADIRNILAVQRTNQWKFTDGEELLFNRIFQSAMLKQNLNGMTEQDIMKKFYFDTWQNNVANYVDRAAFFSNTKDLYYAGDETVTSQEQMKYVGQSTTTSNAVIVELERDVPQRVRMYVWLEGQDVDCVREAALEYLAISIELAGSTQE